MPAEHRQVPTPISQNINDTIGFLESRMTSAVSPCIKKELIHQFLKKLNTFCKYPTTEVMSEKFGAGIQQSSHGSVFEFAGEQLALEETQEVF